MTPYQLIGKLKEYLPQIRKYHLHKVDPNQFPALSPEEERRLKRILESQHVDINSKFVKALAEFGTDLLKDQRAGWNNVVRHEKETNELKKEIESLKESRSRWKKWGLPATAVAGGVAGYVGGHYDSRHPLRRSNEMLSFEEFLDFLNQ